MSFLDKDFLLENEPARELFHNYAEKMPIIDFHCHLNPEEIYENKKFDNITKIWLNEGNYGDHYKWRLMRANGVPEELITGDGDDYEKFVAWAGTIEKAVGNPLYEWTHLELRRFFGINELLTVKSAPSIYKKANEMLKTDDFGARALIRNSNVKAVCTTDDPASDLKYHQLLKQEEADSGFRTLPAMRPDKAFHINDVSYGDYLHELSDISGIVIKSFEDLVTALHQRYEFFTSMGGSLSDHSLESFTFAEATNDQLDTIIAKGIANETLTLEENNQYLTMLIEALMKLNNELIGQFNFILIRHGTLMPNNSQKLGQILAMMLWDHNQISLSRCSSYLKRCQLMVPFLKLLFIL